MGSASVWLLSLVLSWGFPSPYTTLSYEAVYYVTPHSPNPDCPSEEPCFTIDEYAQGSHFDGEDNITLLFLNGEHNLTAQNFEIDHKRLLRMAPSYMHTEECIVIQFLNGTRMFVSSLLEFEVIGLKLVSPNSKVLSGAYFMDIDLLMVSNIGIESCWLSIQGKIKAHITELTANNSFVYSTLLTHNNHTVVIRNSNFHFSTLNIRDDHTSQIFLGDITSALSLETSSMHSSQVSVKLQTHIVYELSLLNSSITSGDNTTSNISTGIRAEIRNTTTFLVLIRNCTIVGNDHALNITVDGNSSVELSVDQCLIVNNSHRHEHAFWRSKYYAGIEVSYLGKHQNIAVIVVSITATILSGKKKSQLLVRGIARNTSVSVFNSTLKNTHYTIFRSNLISCADDYIIDKSGAHLIASDDNSSLTKYTCMFNINFTQNLFENNRIGVNIDSVNCKNLVHFNNNTVINNRVGLSVNAVKMGTVHMSIANSLFAYNKGSAAVICTSANSSLVSFTETIFAQNGNGILVEARGLTVIIENSYVQENFGVSLGVAYPQPSSNKGAINISVRNVTFFNNSNPLPNYNGGIVQVDGRVNLSIEDSCVFRSNHASSIYALTTTVTLSGAIIFEDNSAFQGGAISLSYSMLRFTSKSKKLNTIIRFVNNSATNVGGAIYVNQSPNKDSESGSSCFYDLKILSNDRLNVNIKLIFRGNTASNGGIDVYGATPNSYCYFCFYYPKVYISYEFLCGVYDNVFKTFAKFSSISSEPKRVCLCDSSSQLMCANLSHIFYNTTRYPGEVFLLSLAVVGFEFGRVTGPVYANLLPQANNSMSSLGKGQRVATG